MTHLFVCVRLHGAVVEQTLLPVADRVRLGDRDDASEPVEVSFPGASLWVERVGADLSVRGHRLKPGEQVTISLGAVDVTLEAVVPAPTSPVRSTLSDPRLLLAVAGLVALGGFLDAVDAFAHSNPIVRGALQLEPALHLDADQEQARPWGDAGLLDEGAVLEDVVTMDPTPWYPTVIYRDAPILPARVDDDG